MIVSRNRCRFTGRHFHHPVKCTLWWLRRRAYAKGKRPERGTLLYSPSLDLVYGWEDAIKRQRADDAYVA